MWKFTPDGRTDDRRRTDGRTRDGALWQQLTRAFGSGELKSCLALCHKWIYEIAIFHSINWEHVIKILLTFFCLWNEISLFHKLNYDTARTCILRSLDVPVCVWRHLCASPAVKLVKIYDKTVVFYLFEALACDKRNLKWIFFSYGNYETCYISLARGHKTHKLFHKYRMKWKFISDPLCKSTVFEILIFTW